MTEQIRLSAQDVLDRIGRQKSSTDSASRSWHDAAAPWYRFDLHRLKVGDADHTQRSRWLAPAAVEVWSSPAESESRDPLNKNPSNKDLLWTLKADVRTAALNRLMREGILQKTIARNSHEQLRLENRLFLSLLRGEPPQPQDVGHRQLRQWIEMERLLDHLDAPPENRVDRALLVREWHRERLLEPLRQITRGFVGREKELRALRMHVDTAESEGTLEAVTRFVDRKLRKRRPPLVVYGPGGIGKSTLMARFLLQHLEEPSDPPVLFTLLDVEQPVLSEGRPKEIARVVAQQVRALHPELESLCTRLIEDPPDRDEEAMSELGHMLAQAAELWGDATVLMVFDTFEVLQHGGKHLLDRLAKLLERVDKEVHRLRIVISGRAPVTRMQVFGDHARHLRLAGLPKSAAIEFLVAQGLAENSAADAVAQIGTNPLSLRLAVDVIRQLGVDQLDVKSGFWERLTEEQIQGRLYLRLLDRIDDPLVQKVCHPGMAVRRLDVPVLLEVLNEPCELRLANEADAQNLLDRLEQLVEHISVEPDGSLRFRADLRAATVPLLDKDKNLGRMIRTIHEMAVSHHRVRSGENPTTPETQAARAEEIYHLLELGRASEANERWPEGLELHLGAEIELLEDDARDLVVERARQRHPSDEELREMVGKMIRDGDHDGVLALDEAADNLGKVAPLGLARALQQVGDKERAGNVAREALQAGDWQPSELAELEELQDLLVKSREARRYTPSNKARRLLADFLVSAFSRAELRRFLRYEPFGKQIEVDWEQPARVVFGEVVESLTKRGLVDESLFISLRDARTERTDELGSVERAWIGTDDKAT